MGQSVTIACATTWDLAALGALIEVAARDAGARFAHVGDQVNVAALEIIDGFLMHAGSLLVADEDMDTAFAIEDYGTNEFLDERFRREVPGLKFFSLRFGDLDLTRQVLRAFSVAAVSRGETGWIDTDYGWVIHVRDFVKMTDEDPRWDWRHASNQND